MQFAGAVLQGPHPRSSPPLDNGALPCATSFGLFFARQGCATPAYGGP